MIGDFIHFGYFYGHKQAGADILSGRRTVAEAESRLRGDGLTVTRAQRATFRALARERFLGASPVPLADVVAYRDGQQITGAVWAQQRGSHQRALLVGGARWSNRRRSVAGLLSRINAALDTAFPGWSAAVERVDYKPARSGLVLIAPDGTRCAFRS